MKSIFEYTDYRLFMAEFYAEKKAGNAKFSYRFIAQHVGFKSAGHFTKIIQGKANISVELALRFADFFKFNKKQTDYFQNVVLYNQAKNHIDKRRYFEKLKSFKEANVFTIDASRYEFYEKWYYTCIRELLSYFHFKDNYSELAAQLNPPISENDAHKAIEVLERLGLIVKDSAGYYKQAVSLVMANRGTDSLAIDNFIVNNLELARQAIDRFTKAERKLSATTLTISKETYSRIIEELSEFRSRILSMAEQDMNPSRTYQFNFQVFPVSKAKASRESK